MKNCCFATQAFCFFWALLDEEETPARTNCPDSRWRLVNTLAKQNIFHEGLYIYFVPCFVVMHDINYFCLFNPHVIELCWSL